MAGQPPFPTLTDHAHEQGWEFATIPAQDHTLVRGTYRMLIGFEIRTTRRRQGGGERRPAGPSDQVGWARRYAIILSDRPEQAAAVLREEILGQERHLCLGPAADLERAFTLLGEQAQQARTEGFALSCHSGG